ncbi:MAG: hypothetical protein K0S46_2294 [Moraxellaceae bacterium]|nr:hypothetical protein [Moraxellaceae bacterium]
MELSREVVAYKLKAALASLLVFLVFAAVMAFVSYRFWFPDYLFVTDGGLQGLRLVYAVDFVLGPVLALVFFHPEKTRGKLIFDIAVIASIQIGAMVWGAWQVYSQRPVAVVFGNERFISVAPAIMDLQYETPETLRRFSDDRPPLVYRRAPVGEMEKRRMVGMVFQGGFHHEAQAWLFQPFRANRERIFDRQAGFHEHIGKRLQGRWQDWVAGRATQDMSAYRFALFEGRYENALLIFTPDGQYLDWLSLGEEPLPVIEDPDKVKKAAAAKAAP